MVDETQMSTTPEATEGQLISKQNCRVITSPKKRTDEFVFWERLWLDNFVLFCLVVSEYYNFLTMIEIKDLQVCIEAGFLDYMLLIKNLTVMHELTRRSMLKVYVLQIID